MSHGRRAKIGLILCTFAVCAAAALVQRWRETRRAFVRPTELYDVVLAQMNAFREADYPRAYRTASNTVQEKYNVEAYSDLARNEHTELRRAAPHRIRSDPRRGPPRIGRGIFFHAARRHHPVRLQPRA